MRFLKNFLRKLKLTLIFQGGYPRSGLHYNVFQFPWRSSLFIPVGHSQKRGEKNGLSKKEEMKKLFKNGFPHFLSQKDIPGYPFHGFKLFDFSFPLGPNLGKMTLFSYFFSVSLLIPTSFYIEIFPNLYWPNLTLPQLKLSDFQEIITLNRLT